MPEPDHHPLVAKALKLKGGNQTSFAQALGVTQQTVSRLLNKKRGVTAEMAVAIERATAGEVSRADLRPDLFGKESIAA
jgi:DNA-binding transcriptional regulator YdaS (Cro superfamily)